MFTLAVDGQSTTVPVFVQPDSEQECSNVLGITVVLANGQPLRVSVERENKPVLSSCYYTWDERMLCQGPN